MTGERGGTYAGMVSARRRTSDQKLATTASTINSFLLNGTLVSISAVACAAGVSRNFIYSHDSLLHQLEAARQTQAQAGNIPGQRQPTNGAPGRVALLTELSLAQQTIKRLRQEVADIKDQHQHCLGKQVQAAERSEEGQAATAKSLEIERLSAANRLLRRRVDTLGQRVDDLTDDLTAERRSAIHEQS